MPTATRVRWLHKSYIGKNHFTFLRLPVSGFSAASRPPGPMLLLRDFFVGFFAGDSCGGLNAGTSSTKLSAIFSFSIMSRKSQTE